MTTVGNTPTYMTSISDALAASEQAAAAQEMRAKGANGALDGMGSDAFMKLLTAQMRYQNPMSPKDGTEYLAQISQYAVVEQLQKLTQAQDELGSYQRMMVATNMVGRQVTGVNEAGEIVSSIATQVEYRSGKPLIVTDAGKIAFDKVSTVQSVPTTTTPRS